MVFDFTLLTELVFGPTWWWDRCSPAMTGRPISTATHGIDRLTATATLVKLQHLKNIFPASFGTFPQNSQKNAPVLKETHGLERYRKIYIIVICICTCLGIYRFWGIFRVFVCPFLSFQGAESYFDLEAWSNDFCGIFPMTLPIENQPLM